MSNFCFCCKAWNEECGERGGGAEEKSTSAVVAQVHARPASAASVVADSATAPPLLVDLPRHRRNRPGWTAGRCRRHCCRPRNQRLRRCGSVESRESGVRLAVAGGRMATKETDANVAGQASLRLRWWVRWSGMEIEAVLFPWLPVTPRPCPSIPP